MFGLGKVVCCSRVQAVLLSMQCCSRHEAQESDLRSEDPLRERARQPEHRPHDIWEHQGIGRQAPRRLSTVLEQTSDAGT